MFGPEFKVESDPPSVDLRKIMPRDVGRLPYYPEGGVMQHLSGEVRLNVVELLSWGSGSKLYEWMKEGRDRVNWGLFSRETFDDKLVGYTGLNFVQPSDTEGQDAAWRQAESYMVVLNKEYLGRRIATTTLPHLTTFGLGLGLDCLQASATADNQRACRALERAGYVALGERPELDADGNRRTDFRLYNPALAELAVEHAMTEADRRKNKVLTPEIVLASQDLVSSVQASLPEVQAAATQWLQEDGRATLFATRPA